MILTILNQFLKRYVLRVDLKDSADSQRVILNGRVFYSFGAIKEKARSPYVLRWQRGCTSSSLSDERNVLDGL